MDVDRIADAVLDIIEEPLAAFAKRLEALEKGREQDIDLLGASLDKLRDDLKGHTASAIAAIPPQEPAENDPEQIRQIARDIVDERIAALPVPENGKDGKDGVDGKDGRDGTDGVNGKDGTNGIDGKDGRDGLDVKELFVADGGELVAVFSDGRSKNLGKFRGENGKDGRDGFGFDDLEMEYDGKRTFAFVMKRAADAKRYEFKAPVVIDCGVWKEGSQYETGDGVTWGGSFWIAQKDTTDKPDVGAANGSWRLAVKKGRDGKN